MTRSKTHRAYADSFYNRKLVWNFYLSGLSATTVAGAPLDVKFSDGKSVMPSKPTKQMRKLHKQVASIMANGSGLQSLIKPTPQPDEHSIVGLNSSSYAYILRPLRIDAIDQRTGQSIRYTHATQ